MHRTFLTALVLLLFHMLVSAQTPPLYETRGVWLTTAHRLDWPPIADSTTQKMQLEAILRTVRAMGLNTVFFQAVSAGDALYPSERLPWSPNMTGTPGKDPGWDPLAFAVQKAHELGLELHVWYNTFKVGSDDIPVSPTATPLHVRIAHPEWIEEQHIPLSSTDTLTVYWLNPAYPEVRQWVAGNVLEIVEKYDVDGIHFDFIRYPPGGFASDFDNFQFPSLNPDGIDDIDEWRRENISRFVRNTYLAIKEKKPWVRVGSAVIGNYTGSPRALRGFDDVYQASRQWVDEGVHDYLAPMLYWDIDHWPRFDSLAYDWTQHAAGRHIYTGIGAYVPTVYAEIPRQIDTTRVAGAQGQIYFRYTHIARTPPPFEDRYRTPALPPAMPWHFEARDPDPPANLRAEQTPEGYVRLSWKTPATSSLDPLGGYGLFRHTSTPAEIHQSSFLLARLGSVDTTYVDTAPPSSGEPVYYTLIAFSRLGYTSTGTTVSITPTAAESPRLHVLRIHPPYPNPANTRVILRYDLSHSIHLRVRIFDLLGRIVQEVLDQQVGAGSHVLTLSTSRLPAGTYVLTFASSDEQRYYMLTVVH